MSHQTGITADEELEEFFSVCKNGHIRTFAVMIENERLCRSSWSSAIGSWEDDYTSQVLPLLEEKVVRYILFRLDASGCSNNKKVDSVTEEWLMLLWSPDDAPVRQKMLYASTKATLKMQFGSMLVKDELFASSRDDATLAAYKKHRVASGTPAPLTMREEELQEVKRQEVGADIGVDTRQHALTGVSFPLTKAATAALQSFTNADLQYVRLRINLDVEEIDEDGSMETLAVDRLKDEVPETSARYHLYRYDHNHEGDYLHSVVFIYSMPGYSCPIKERMVYSSSKSPVLDYLQASLSLNISKKMEISEGSELSEELLLEELHPKQCLHKPRFSKPKGPVTRGNKRLTKTPPTDQ